MTDKRRGACSTSRAGEATSVRSSETGAIMSSAALRVLFGRFRYQRGTLRFRPHTIFHL